MPGAQQGREGPLVACGQALSLHPVGLLNYHGPCGACVCQRSTSGVFLNRCTEPGASAARLLAREPRTLLSPPVHCWNHRHVCCVQVLHGFKVRSSCLHGYVSSPSTAMGLRARRHLKSPEPEGFEFWNQKRSEVCILINKLDEKTFQHHTVAQETREEAEPRSRQDWPKLTY